MAQECDDDEWAVRVLQGMKIDVLYGEEIADALVVV